MLPAFIFMQSSPFRQCEMTKMASHNIPVCKESIEIKPNSIIQDLFN